jgi:hypothetical protein
VIRAEGATDSNSWQRLGVLLHVVGAALIFSLVRAMRQPPRPRRHSMNERSVVVSTKKGLILAAAAFSALSCSGDSMTRVRPPASAGGGGGAGEPRPEERWLDAIGKGRAQTERVCRSGVRDRVATALCAESAGAIRGLSDLYRAIGFGEPRDRYIASTTHSLGLSARSVSAANPRTFVFTPDRAPIVPERHVATGFARGEQLVELAALDVATLDYNFYLLRFEQACNASRCTPDDLLTDKVETGWTGFTLYSDRDLVDTPLDCTSCHQPFGGGTHKQLLMRQTAHPWLHWGDFRGESEHRICPDYTGPPPGRWIPGEGLTLLVRLEGRDGRHGGLSVGELADAPSGERFSLFLTDAENSIRASPYPAGYPYANIESDSTRVLCERLEGTSATWERDRRDSLAKGHPVPYYGPDILDPEQRAVVAQDRAAFLARHSHDDALDVAMSLVAQEAATAIGFYPRESDTAPEMLRTMCVRCHSSQADRNLRRARFDAENLERFEPTVARMVRERLTLPRTSPELMPPLRAGELPAWAIARIDAYLRERCIVPGGCD